MRLRHHLLASLAIIAAGSTAFALKHPVSAVCATDPTLALAGESVSVHVIPTGFIPDRVLTYTFTSTGGALTADSSANAKVLTEGLQPGNYNVSSLVSDDHNLKHRLYATCQAAFSIKEPPKHPPLLRVRAEPQTVNSGDSVTVTAEGYSKDDRPLHINCLTTKGTLSGGSTLYVLNTAGLPGGLIDINCSVQDDRSLSAFADAKVMVTVPPPRPRRQLASTAKVWTLQKTSGVQPESITLPKDCWIAMPMHSRATQKRRALSSAMTALPNEFPGGTARTRKGQ